MTKFKTWSRQIMFYTKILKIYKISNFGKKFPNSEFFSQNFQNHRGAANDIKGAAASLLVNSKISIFNWELPLLGVYNIKHNLVKSCFQFWPAKSAPKVTKFREKNWWGVSRDSFFLKILSPSEPILRAKIENMISSDYVLCYIPRALETLEKMKIL